MGKEEKERSVGRWWLELAMARGGCGWRIQWTRLEVEVMVVEMVMRCWLVELGLWVEMEDCGGEDSGGGDVRRSR